MKYRIVVLFLFLLLSLMGTLLSSCADEGEAVYPYGPPEVHFPEDEGAHPEFGEEWWYFNSNLEDSEGREYTVMVAYFSPSLKIISISDLTDKTFYQYVPSFQELITATPDYAEGSLDLRWDDYDQWYRTEQDTYSYRLKASGTTVKLDLNLVSEKPPLLVGGDGYIDWTDNGTYYYSLTRLQVEGEIEIEGQRTEVEGIGWMDHQWMEILAEGGWDWFSVQLDNDTEIILWQIINQDGSIESRALTIMFADDSSYFTDDIELDKLDSWRSPETGKEYGISWRVREEEYALDFQIDARYPEQEIIVLPDLEDFELDFWEGGTVVSGRLNGENVTGVGYAEMVPQCAGIHTCGSGN